MTATPDIPSGGDTACPRCGQAGRLVSAVTLEAIALPAARERLGRLTGYRFCATPACDVAYFNPAASELVLQREVRVPIFQKSADPQRPVCYCFGHTAAAVQKEVRSKGASRILEDIKGRCAQGLDACEPNNPQGSCCLGNVQRLVREASGGSAPSAAGDCCCCSGDKRDEDGNSTKPQSQS